MPSKAGTAGACLQRWEGSKSEEASGRRMETTPLSPPTNNQRLPQTVGQAVSQPETTRDTQRHQETVSQPETVPPLSPSPLTAD